MFRFRRSALVPFMTEDGMKAKRLCANALGLICIGSYKIDLLYIHELMVLNSFGLLCAVVKTAL